MALHGLHEHRDDSGDLWGHPQLLSGFFALAYLALLAVVAGVNALRRGRPEA
jgi:hypothetical protein